MKNNIAVCVPTFHEKDHVFLFLESLNSLQYNFKEVLIVNGDYGDETSDLINECKSYMNLNIKEIPGKKNELWSGTVNRGLNKILIEYGSNIDILLCNIDIIFEDSTIDNLLNSSKILGRRNIIGAVGIYKDKVFCSGVKVKSWLFPIRNLHPFENILREELDNCDYAYVDFLPCRCIFIPSDVNLLIDSISYKKLPHYHADYEFTYRLKREGAKLIIDPSARIHLDMENTGISVFNDKFDAVIFFKNLFNIKHVSNIKYRINFVLLTFPWYAKLTALIVYLLKTLTELCLGLIYSIKNYKK